MRLMETFNVIKTLFARQSGAFTREGHKLSERDSLTVGDAYLSWVCLLADLKYLDPVEHSSIAGRIISDLYRTDIKVVLKALAEMYSLVQRGTCRGFKALAYEVSPSLWRLIRDDVNSLDLKDADAARRLLQMSAYLTRLSLQDLDQTEESIQDYLETEASIPSEFPTSITDSLNRIIRFWLRGFNRDDIEFRHGNGSVAFVSPPTLENKYKHLGSDRKIDIVFKDIYEYYVPNLLSPPGNPAKLVIDRRSETTFVAKSWKSMRTISMESPTLMYLQQGVLAAIDRMVENSPYLRNRIGTHDQTRNQILARRGSLRRDFATIDLSAASDSVAWTLVKKLFKGTALYPYLIATRSTHTVLPDDREVLLKKFAPMGSALCFPIETIVFASVCELVTRRWHHASGGASQFSGQFSVYGDDIICPIECAEDVISVLNMLGFKVNTDKSFWSEDEWYRESCGGEYVDGFDITPMRISRKFQSSYQVNGQRLKPKEVHESTDSGITGYVDAANRAFERGLSLLRCFYIQKLVAHEYTPLFGDTGILTYNPTNFHTHVRRHPDLQRDQVRLSLFVPKDQKEVERARGDEEIAYRHWLELAMYRQVQEQRKLSQRVIRLVSVWKSGVRSFVPLTIDRSVVSETRVGPSPRTKLKKAWQPARTAGALLLEQKFPF